MYSKLRSIGHHQVAYEPVGLLIQVQFAFSAYVSFYTIVTNYNEPLAAAQAHIHGATHTSKDIELIKYGQAYT